MNEKEQKEKKKTNEKNLLLKQKHKKTSWPAVKVIPFQFSQGNGQMNPKIKIH